MSITQYDPVEWLESATRAIGSYVTATLNDPDTTVEMSYPDTHNWTKSTPLDKALVHFERDSISDPVLGFGKPSITVVNDVTNEVTDTEITQHLLDFDVGVWTSAEMGGATKRMQIVRKLKDMFVTVTGKTALEEATGGLWIVSFEGGRDQLDRINDLPVWRAMDMTLIVKVFSRHAPPAPDVLIGDLAENEQLTIIGNGGISEPVTTP